MSSRDGSTEQLLEEIAGLEMQVSKLRTSLSRYESGEYESGEDTGLQPELEAIFQALPDLYFRLDANGTILELRAGCAADLYFPKETYMEKRIQDVHLGVGKKFQQAIRQAIETGSLSIMEYYIPLKPEKQFYEARFVPLLKDQVIVVVRNITERKKAEEQLKYLSLHDALTGLYNRAYFEQEMQRLNTGWRYFPVSIIVCDIDGLKLVNDILGHKTGDRLIAKAADIIRKCFRQGEMIARIGGDEFAVLLPNSGQRVARNAGIRLRKAFAAYNTRGGGLPLSISIGYDVGQRDTAVQDIFKKADDCMYREKLHRSRSVRSAIIQNLIETLETRDLTDKQRAGRMQKLVMSIATALRLSRQSVIDLSLLAQFHDIGNVGVPERILFKAGLLSSEEIIEMQRHCEIGYRIAESAPELQHIADWILKHHEWFDGNGYPLGLSGEHIPLESRIIAIIDAYDAMTSNRPYRKAMAHEKAVAELKRCSGTQFDPHLVAEFINCLSKPESKCEQEYVI